MIDLPHPIAVSAPWSRSGKWKDESQRHSVPLPLMKAHRWHKSSRSNFSRGVSEWLYCHELFWFVKMVSIKKWHTTQNFLSLLATAPHSPIPTSVRGCPGTRSTLPSEGEPPEPLYWWTERSSIRQPEQNCLKKVKF